MAGGELAEHAAERELLDAALAAGLGDSEARRTIRSAREAEMREPRRAPERDRVAPAHHVRTPEARKAEQDGPPALALRVVDAAEFAALDEPSAEPLLGDDEGCLLAADGTFLLYGKGGSGKTTLEADLGVHLAAAVDWLGVPVPRRSRVLVIENEGPRGKFRRKLRAKLAAWDGPSVDGHLFVMEEPWASFSFATDAQRTELIAYIREHSIDVLMAGPVHRLGVKGGGTPEEVIAFVGLVERIRRELGRPLAVILVHHDNKQGTVSGA